MIIFFVLLVLLFFFLIKSGEENNQAFFVLAELFDLPLEFKFPPHSFGIFTTLYRNGEVLGCMGNYNFQNPIKDTVYVDSRYPKPVKFYHDTILEVNFLLKPLYDFPQKNSGIMYKRTTFLPNVFPEINDEVRRKLVLKAGENPLNAKAEDFKYYDTIKSRISFWDFMQLYGQRLRKEFVEEITLEILNDFFEKEGKVRGNAVVRALYEYSKNLNRNSKKYLKYFRPGKPQANAFIIPLTEKMRKEMAERLPNAERIFEYPELCLALGIKPEKTKIENVFHWNWLSQATSGADWLADYKPTLRYDNERAVFFESLKYYGRKQKTFEIFLLLAKKKNMRLDLRVHFLNGFSC